MQFDSESKKQLYSPPTLVKLWGRRNSSWPAVPIAAIRKQRSCWSRYVKNDSRTRSNDAVLMRKIGLNRCPYCGKDESCTLPGRRPAVMKCVCSSFSKS
jgi:hypothetical protein